MKLIIYGKKYDPITFYGKKFIFFTLNGECHILPTIFWWIRNFTNARIFDNFFLKFIFYYNKCGNLFYKFKKIFIKYPFNLKNIKIFDNS